MKLNKYLFCYFVGNEPHEESVHFAVSKDGYRFTALNNNKPIIKQELGKKCCRDPFIFRDQEGIFHIIGTDMRCHDGWCSNNSMVIWDSLDLIKWENERIVDFSQFPETKNADRVWAPEVIYDKLRNEYMIYWSNHNTNDNLSTIIWYAYTKDFHTLTTNPAVLFMPKSNLAGIDGDIVEKDGKYFLFQADEGKSAICYAVSNKPNGPYFEPDDNKISVADVALEGNCTYKILNENKYVLIADQFRNGGYFMQESEDLINWKAVDKSKIALDQLSPRHGSMLHITDDEYNRLIEHYK